MPSDDKKRTESRDARKGRVENEPPADDELADPLDDDQADSGPDRDHKDLGA
jgi:hypothetical protein